MKKNIIWGIVIYFLAVSAWVVLGMVTFLRDVEQRGFLSNRVEKLCGSRLVQQELTLTLPDGQDKTKNVTSTNLSGSKINVDLKLDPRKKGLIWFPVYSCNFDAVYTIVNNSSQDKEYNVKFNFPAKGGTYNNIKLTLDGKNFDPEIDLYKGIEFKLPLAAGESKELQIVYKTFGSYHWKYAPGGRIRNLNLTVNTDFLNVDYPDGAISPTKVQQDKASGKCTLNWQADNLLSGNAIEIEMPRKLNPGDVIPRVTFFAPVGLFFFVLILGVIGILKKIEIHPMHFLFTAAGFFSFSLLFAYLSDHVNINISFAISSFVTLTMVGFYLRGALKENFPWKSAVTAQFFYLILFSYSFFFKGLTGLTVTAGVIITLALLMILTINVNWSSVFERSGNKRV